MHTQDKNSMRVVGAFALVSIILVVGLLWIMDTVSTNQNRSGTESGFGESRAVPAPMFEETEAPLPLQIDTNAPAKVTVRTKLKF